MSSSLILAALVGALIGAAVTALALGGWARVVSRRNARLHEDLLGATADAARSSERLRELEAATGTDEERLRGLFAKVSQEALTVNAEQFLQLAETRLGAARDAAAVELDRRTDSVQQILEPLGAQLERYSTAVAEIENKRTDAYRLLVERVDSLAKLGQDLRHETARLVQSLRAPQTRGRWGELQLRRVVELAGMVNKVDFIEQVSTDGESGKLRPDMVINLPGGGTIVVDSKVPLQAFLDANDATTEAERATALARHASQLRTHITQLGSKEYWKQFPTAPDYVVCFIPGEPLANAAFEQDPSLMEDALKLNVIPATPTNLVTLLKTVAHNWRYEDIEQKAKAIIDLGTELYDRLRTVSGHLDQMRKSLTKTVDSYNALLGSVESRLLVTARTLHDTNMAGTAAAPIVSPQGIELMPRRAQAPALTTPLEDS